MQNNKVEVGGYVAKYEERQTNNGKTIARFGLKIYNGKKDGQSQYAFINVKAFTSLELVDKQEVNVIGHLLVEEWTDKQGNKRSAVVVIADKVDAMPMKSEPPNKENGFVNDDLPPF